jgi:hypothetical protein
MTCKFHYPARWLRLAVVGNPPLTVTMAGDNRMRFIDPRLDATCDRRRNWWPC